MIATGIRPKSSSGNGIFCTGNEIYVLGLDSLGATTRDAGALVGQGDEQQSKGTC